MVICTTSIHPHTSKLCVFSSLVLLLLRISSALAPGRGGDALSLTFTAQRALEVVHSHDVGGLKSHSIDHSDIVGRHASLPLPSLSKGGCSCFSATFPLKYLCRVVMSRIIKAIVIMLACGFFLFAFVLLRTRFATGHHAFLIFHGQLQRTVRGASPHGQDCCVVVLRLCC